MSAESHPEQRQRQRPRFGKLRDATDYGGVSRSRLYVWSKIRPELFRKLGRATLIDFDVYDQMLDELPVAGIKDDQA